MILLAEWRGKVECFDGKVESAGAKVEDIHVNVERIAWKVDSEDFISRVA